MLLIGITRIIFIDFQSHRIFTAKGTAYEHIIVSTDQSQRGQVACGVELGDKLGPMD